MISDTPQAFLDALKTGDVVRYIIIFFGNEERYFAGFSYHVTEEIVCTPSLLELGERRVGGDIAVALSSIALPTIVRDFTLANTEEFGWIVKDFNRTQENKEVEFHVVGGGYDIVEDRLLIRDPIEWQEGDVGIKITAISFFQGSDPYLGVLDSLTNKFTSVAVGDIGYAFGVFEESLSGPYAKLSSTCLSGSSSLTCDRDLVTAGFPASGTVIIDFEEMAYSSIGGADNKIMTLVSPATDTHLSSSYVFKKGDFYYYSFGPGPVDNIGTLTYKKDGNDVAYTGEFEIINGALILAKFADSLPFFTENASSQQTITKNINASNFTFSNGGSADGANVIKRTGGATDKVKIAEASFGIALPPDSTFVSGYVDVKYTLNQYIKSNTTYGEKSLNLTLGNMVCTQGTYVEGGNLRIVLGSSASDGRYRGATLSGYGISLPAGSTFVEGYVNFSMVMRGYRGVLIDTYSGSWGGWKVGSYVEATRCGQLATAQRQAPATIDSESLLNFAMNRNASSESDLTSSNNYFKIFYDLSLMSQYNTLKSLGYSLDNGRCTILRDFVWQMYMRWQAISSNAAWTTATEKLLGTVRERGKLVSPDVRFNASNAGQLSSANNKITFYVQQGISSSVTFNGVSISNITMSMTYTQVTPGYPKRTVIPADQFQLRIGSSGSDVNPVDVAMGVMFRKRGGITFDPVATAAAKSYYDQHSFKMNGYLDGQLRTNEALRLVMMQSIMRLNDRGGVIVPSVRLMPNDAVAVASFDDESRGKDDGISWQRQGASDVKNRVQVQYNANAQGEYQSSLIVTDDASIEQIKAQDAEVQQFQLVDSTSFATTVVNYWVQRNSLPFNILTFSCYHEAWGVEIGDYVTLKSNFGSLPGLIKGEVVGKTTRYLKSGDTAAPYSLTIVYGGTTSEEILVGVSDSMEVDDKILYLTPKILTDTIQEGEVLPVVATVPSWGEFTWGMNKWGI